AITGFPSDSTRSLTRTAVRARSRTASAGAALIQRISAPAEKAAPAPVTITAATAASARARPSAVSRARSSASSIAFKASGRLRTTCAMPSFARYSTRSAGMLHLRGDGRRVLRDAVAERPVLLLHLDEVDEHVLGTHAELAPQPLRDGRVELALGVDRAPLGEGDLYGHEAVGAADA